jgi:hypothetical protein
VKRWPSPDTVLATQNPLSGFGWGVHNATDPHGSSACEDIDSIGALSSLLEIAKIMEIDITTTHAHLAAPAATPDAQVWRYGVGFPLQIAPDLAGVFAGIEVAGTGNYGHLNGSDLVLFDDLSRLDDARAVALSRNECRRDQVTGLPVFVLRSPMYGGFMPLGAVRPNGTPVPHGGTGFGLSQAHLFPNSDGRLFSWADPERSDRLETRQFTYDGRAFATSAPQIWTQDGSRPLIIGDSPWRIISHGLTMAIPDDDDLLLPVLAGTVDNGLTCVGVTRWRYAQTRWAPDSFVPVSAAAGPGAGASLAEQCPWFEPTLTRGRNGTLLFCARSQPGSELEGAGYPIQIWQSTDGGNTWVLIVDMDNIRNDSPVSIHCGLGGSAFAASNPFKSNSQASPVIGRGRDRLCLWPVDFERSRLGQPLTICDAIRDFGPPPISPASGHPETWMVDHPNATTLKLADGRAHSVLAYRVMHSPPYRPSAARPSPATGCYLVDFPVHGSGR